MYKEPISRRPVILKCKKVIIFNKSSRVHHFNNYQNICFQKYSIQVLEDGRGSKKNWVLFIFIVVILIAVDFRKYLDNNNCSMIFYIE